MAEKVCSTCKRKVTSDEGAVTFACPRCGKEHITRCTHCRKLATRYRCSKCDFFGPN